MYIKKVKINNFQSYFGEHSLELTKGVNIFYGKNQSGKSKFFNVFNWGFFNRIYGRDQDGVKDWHQDLESFGAKICNYYALSKIKKNEVIRMSVDIEFCSIIPRDGVLEKSSLPDKAYLTEVDYFLTRSISYKLNSDPKLASDIDNWSIVNDGEDLDLYFKFAGETFYLNNPEVEIEKIFPIEIRDYMWFQGEAIEDLVDFQDSHKLRDAIYKISYFPVYEKLSELIKDSVRLVEEQILKKKRKNQKNEKEYNSIAYDIDSCLKKLDKEEIYNEGIINQIDDTKTDISKMTSKLRTIHEYPKYYEQETTFKAELDAALKITATLDEIRREKIIKNWMMKGIDIIHDDIQEIFKNFEAKVKASSPTNNPLPLLIPGEEWINKMIKEKKCHVCDRDYDPKVDTIVHEALLKRSSQSNLKKNEDEKQLNYFYTQLFELSDEFFNKNNLISDDIDNFNQKVNDEWENVRDAREKLDKITQTIKSKFGTSSISNEAKNASEILDKKDIYDTKLSKLERKLKFSNDTIIDYKQDLIKYKNDLKKNEKPSAVKLKEETFLKYYQFLESSLNTLKDNAFRNLLIDIENKANELYKNYLSHRATDGGSLFIDKQTLELSNFTKDGAIRDSNQSNEDIAKISVINAILSLNALKTGIHFPFITDAPSSSFDMETTIAYTSALPNLFDQCIIISKDFDEESIDSLSSSKDIKSIFKLEYDTVDNQLEKIEENSTTIIKKIK